MSNIYSQEAKKYLEKGYSVIPDKQDSKAPAIKSWTEYCFRLPSSDEALSWSNSFKDTNIALCLGEASGIIALDIDAIDQRILDIVMPILPESPVVKIGSKGETRFFKYMHETTQVLSFNGEIVFEILSTNKKTTIPPSIHPDTGKAYVWKDASLLDIDKDSLPMLPPMLISNIESVLKSELRDIVQGSHGKVTSGRNGTLSTYCSDLIRDRVPVDEAINKLISLDKEKNDPPLFTDSSELRHTEPFTNALQFYANHLSTVNSRRFHRNEVYEIPITLSAITAEMIPAPKSQAQVSRKSLKTLELPVAKNVLGSLIQNVLDNSFIKQPEFAYSAAFALVSTLIARKVVFRAISPNLYLLNIAPSGAGKDAPQQLLKKWLIDLGADSLLGAGDYASDASLIDNLHNRPVRLDLIDEASGLLGAINNSRNSYDGKMADILCQLYTTSNSKFLGRALANKDGNPVIKGVCYRPNVNLLCSTTPVGFSTSVSSQSLDKGLLGRFLIFLGVNGESEPLEAFPTLDGEVKSHLLALYNYKPEENKNATMGTMVQDVTELGITEEASARMRVIFKEFDAMRMKAKEDEPLLPVIARLYQQMTKIIIIHTCCNIEHNLPKIGIEDVNFGYNMIQYLYQNMKSLINKYVYGSKQEMLSNKLLNAITSDGVTKAELYSKTRALTVKQREEMLKELEDSDKISVNMEIVNGKRTMVYRSKYDV